MSRPNVIPAFPPTPLQNRGRNFVRSKRRSTYTSSGTLYLFCALTIRKHLLNLSGRGPSICYRRPFCRLKAPLGLSLLRCASQTRSMRFERSGRGQEPSRGHKFSILENFLSIRDFASQTLASFLSDLVGACLPQPLLRTDEEELCQFDTIPPRISIYAANINLLFLIQLVSE